MGRKINASMGTEPVRLDSGIMELVRGYKRATGFPIGRFIEDAIAEKVGKLSKEVKEKMGLTTFNK